jgi:hypothetical protein
MIDNNAQFCNKNNIFSFSFLHSVKGFLSKYDHKVEDGINEELYNIELKIMADNKLKIKRVINNEYKMMGCGMICEDIVIDFNNK